MDSEELTLEFAQSALGDEFNPDCKYFLHTTESGFLIDRYNPATEERDVFPLAGDPGDSLYSYEAGDEIPDNLAAAPSSAEPNFVQRFIWKLLMYPWQLTAVMTVLAMVVVMLLLREATGNG